MDFDAIPVRALARYKRIYNIDNAPQHTPSQMQSETETLSRHFASLNNTVDQSFESDSIAYFIYSIRNQGKLVGILLMKDKVLKLTPKFSLKNKDS